MNALLWRLRQGARRLGATGLVGLALLAAALGLQLTAVTATRAAVAAKDARLAQLRVAAQARAARPAPPPVDPLARLPAKGSASRQIGELERLARDHGLDLPRGQYSVSALSGTPLLRWQLVLPVEATYATLHAFLVAALAHSPNLTLDEFKLKRERIESPELQAELRLSLFVEAAP